MGFLTPALLFLGAAVAVPLILHLFQRHQGPRLVFPALRYLQRAEKEHARQIKLRQILLLALRMAALALIAFAAARPFLRSGGAAHEPTAVAIVLDNSLSSGVVLGERRVLDRLKNRALETLARGGPDDRFWLIRAGAPWEAAIPGNAQTTAERVIETGVAAGTADLHAAVDRARTLLSAGADGRATEIHLLSDLQTTAFTAPLSATASSTAPATAGSAASAASGTEDAGPPIFVWSPDDELPANAAVAAVEVGGGLPPRAGERSTVTARVVGSEDGDSLTVRLAVDGRITAADMAPTGSAVALPFPARAGGLVSGWVEIDPDALRGDDRRYFVIRVQPPPAVAMTRPIDFVDEALGVLTDAGRIRRTEPAAADVVLAPAAEGIDAVRSGRAVVVLPPTSPLELPGANRRLAAAGVPWRFRAPDGAGEARFEGPANETAPTDELFRTLEDVRIREVYGLEPQRAAGGAGPAADSVLLRLRDGRPWAVRGTLPGGGRYLVLATPFSLSASTLPTSPAMLVLLDRLVGAWAASQSERTRIVPGDLVSIPPDAQTVERPDGVRDEVEGGGRYRVPATPGVYQVRAGDRVVDAFAVNPAPAESTLERLGESRLEALLPGWNLIAVDDADDWAQTVFHRRLGSEVWRPLVLLALAVLLIEGLTAAAGPARARASSDRGGSRSAADTPPAAAVPPAAPRPGAVAMPGGGGGDSPVTPASADSHSPTERTA